MRAKLISFTIFQEAQAELASTVAQFENLKAEIKTAGQKTAPWVSEREQLEKDATAASKLSSKIGVSNCSSPTLKYMTNFLLVVGKITECSCC